MARFGIIGDPHGNHEALTAALRELGRRNIDQVWCVGDLVGYNADPDAVVAELEKSAVCIAGNHDRVAIGALGSERCWYGARYALGRTRETIGDRALAYLATLPTVRPVDKGLYLFHGCIDDVTRYCRGERELLHNDRLLGERHPRVWLACFGHTHVPGIHAVRNGEHGRIVDHLGGTGRIELDYGARFFLNPGFIDGARREQPVAQFAVLDTLDRTVELCEVPYDAKTSELKSRRGGFRPGWPARIRGELRGMVRAGVSRLTQHG